MPESQKNIREKESQEQESESQDQERELPSAEAEKTQEAEPAGLSEAAAAALKFFRTKPRGLAFFDSPSSLRFMSRPERRESIRHLEVLDQEHDALFRELWEDFSKQRYGDGGEGGSDFREADIAQMFAEEKDIPYLEKVLGEERVWNNRDGSTQHTIIDTLEDLHSNRAIPALTNLVRNIMRPRDPEWGGYQREHLKGGDLTSAFVALNSIGTPEAHDAIEALVQEYPHLKHIVEVEPRTGFSFEREPKKSVPEIIELAKELEKNRDYSLLIRGSAVLAEELGRGKDQVRDIDVFMVENQRLRSGQALRVREHLNLEELAKELSREDVAQIREWMRRHGYEGRRIDLVFTDAHSLRQNDVYVDEPEVVLFDGRMETLSNVLQPISREDRERLERSFLLGDEYLLTRSPEERRGGGRERLHMPTLLDAAERLARYQEGRLVEGKVPETLVPNGTAARALRCLDISERFGIPADTTLLEEIEKDAKNGTLEITPSFEGAYSYRQIQRGIDEVLVKVALGKESNGVLQKNYPHLWGTLNAIREAGGSIQDFIRKNYGEAYINAFRLGRPFHLYDVKIVGSPATLDEQYEFLEVWDRYVEHSVHFGFGGVKKENERADLPDCPALKELVNQRELKRRMRARGKKTRVLESLVGLYRVNAGHAESIGAREKIEALLKVHHLDWADVAEKNRGNLTRQLVRLGVHPRNPILRELDNTEAHTVELVISQEPDAILQASTDKPWTSCVDLHRGSTAPIRGLGLYEDIGNGSCVAYLLKEGKFVGRVLLRAGEDEEGRRVAIPEHYYGDQKYALIMSDALQSVIEEHNLFPATEAKTLHAFPDAWSDRGNRQRATHKLVYPPSSRRRLSTGGEGVGEQHVIPEEEQREIERIIQEGPFVPRHAAGF